VTRLAVLPGDGVGPEVVEEALLLLDELRLDLEIDLLDHVSADRYRRTGIALSDDDLERIRRSDAVLLGAIGAPGVDGDYARGVLLRMRLDFDLYANLRPVRLLDDRLSPLRDPARRPVDLRIVRENTEGLYVGVGGRVRPGTDQEVGIDVEVTTHGGVQRVLRYAFGIARTGVCLVDKSNAVPSGGAVWQRAWAEEIPAWPGLTTSHLYADVAAMHLVADPGQFDVLVTNNSYGDLLSDLAAQVAGGLGGAASANLNPETGFGLYEPVHGSAPDIAGKQVANPIGAILSAGLLLEDAGHPVAADRVRKAVAAAVAAQRCTRDFGGTLDTRAAGAAIRAEL